MAETQATPERTGDTLREAAEAIRDWHHARGNRFGAMSRHHKDEATFMLGMEAQKHLALAEKWELAQHLEYNAASAVSDALGIPEYGRAWKERLMPSDLERANA